MVCEGPDAERNIAPHRARISLDDELVALALRIPPSTKNPTILKTSATRTMATTSTARKTPIATIPILMKMRRTGTRQLKRI